MNRLITRIWLLLVIAFLSNACSSTAPQVKRDKTMAYRTVIQPRTAPPQNVYNPATYSGTQSRTALPQNVYGSATHSFNQPRTTSRQSIDRSATHFGPFQKPPELEPAVEFWRKTYTLWHGSEVAFHDDRYLNVIYEVMVVPGYVDDSLTTEQKEIIKQRRDFWKAQLSALESKLRYNVPLNANDRQLIAKLESSGGQLNSVLDGAAERVRSQRGIRERFRQGLEISRRYDLKFRKIFRDAGLPEDLAYLPHVESSFQASAKSSAGAVGIWQFTKHTAKRFMPASYKQNSSRSHSHKQRRSRSGSHNQRRRVDPRLDPYASTIGAACYLSYAYNILGDWPTAITSYNHGISGMKRAQNQVGRDFVRIVETYNSPAFGFASRNFYAQFLAAREIASNPNRYFPERVSEVARQ
ncbi:MAG: lytic transglycosylase domain-containing protein [Gammaproteobacteria bacterium]